MLASMYANHVPATARLGRAVADDERMRAIFSLLRNNPNADALLTGGSARDAIIGRIPKNTHILVRGVTPQALTAHFNKNGDQFTAHGQGLIKVQTTGGSLNVELPQVETRKSAIAHHTASLQQDLARRDFTANALAYSLKDGILHDPWKGLEDIHAKKLKTIGAPKERFAKDPLRTLRLIRLASELGFTIDTKTWNAASQAVPRLSATHQNDLGETEFQIPRAKVGAEISRAITANPRYAFSMLSKSGVFAETINLNNAAEEATEKQLAHLADQDFLRLHRLKSASPSMVFAALFTHLDDAGEKFARKAMAGLHLHQAHEHGAHGFSHLVVAKLLKDLRSLHNLPSHGNHEITHLLASDHADELLALAHAHSLAHPTNSTFKERLHALRRHKEELQLVNPVKLMRGRDLIALKIPPGPHVRTLLKRIRSAQLTGDISDKDEALSFARSLYNALA
ncbi:CCA tRNA nucleotidyltransferase [Patescibacteria group bacterium]|nr:CCA tRNA nucleotidyltransferase [Patescibacteria group bacterium]